MCVESAQLLGENRVRPAAQGSVDVSLLDSYRCSQRESARAREREREREREKQRALMSLSWRATGTYVCVCMYVYTPHLTHISITPLHPTPPPPSLPLYIGSVRSLMSLDLPHVSLKTITKPAVCSWVSVRGGRGRRGGWGHISAYKQRIYV